MKTLQMAIIAAALASARNHDESVPDKGKERDLSLDGVFGKGSMASLSKGPKPKRWPNKRRLFRP
jgi:hypothetical protein